MDSVHSRLGREREGSDGRTELWQMTWAYGREMPQTDVHGTDGRRMTPTDGRRVFRLDTPGCWKATRATAG